MLAWSRWVPISEGVPYDVPERESSSGGANGKPVLRPRFDLRVSPMRFGLRDALVDRCVRSSWKGPADQLRRIGRALKVGEVTGPGQVDVNGTR